MLFVISKKPLPNPISWWIKPMRPSKSFTVFALTYRSLIHLELFYIWHEEGANFIYLHVSIRLSQNHLLHRLLAPWMVLASCQRKLTINVCVSFWTLNSIPLTYILPLCFAGVKQKQRFYVLLLSQLQSDFFNGYFSRYREGLQGHRRKWSLVLLHGFIPFLPSPGWESCVKQRHPSLLCSLASFSKAQN